MSDTRTVSVHRNWTSTSRLLKTGPAPRRDPTLHKERGSWGPGETFVTLPMPDSLLNGCTANFKICGPKRFQSKTGGIGRREGDGLS